MKTVIRTTLLSLAAATAAVVVGVLVSDVTLPSFSPGAIFSEDRTVRLTFVGDIMLDRYIRQQHHPDQYHAIASEFTPLFYQSDLVMGNLEGTITRASSTSKNTYIGDAGNTRFTFAPKSTAFLTSHDFDLVSIGNNHIRDFGPSGIEQTKTHLDESNIAFIGDPTDPTNSYRLQRDGISVAITTFNQFGSQSHKATERAIRELARGNDWVIVYTHWGTEYASQPNQYQQQTARAFARAGADLVIGSHPHVWQPRRTILDTTVYYSLGNFVFDQFFSRPVRCGGVLSLTLNETGVVEETVADAYMTTDGIVRKRPCGINASNLRS